MDDKVIKFKKPTVEAETEAFEKEAWENYEVLIDIIRGNIEALNDGFDHAYPILFNSPFNLEPDTEISNFCIGFCKGWLSLFLGDLTCPVVRDSYLKSCLVNQLFNAVVLMKVRLPVSISLVSTGVINTIKLNGSSTDWYISNMFSNGVSIWEALRMELIEKGYTEEDLYC